MNRIKTFLKKFIIKIALFIGIIGYMGNVLAQTTVPDISQIKFLYEELRFEEAIKSGQYILKEEDELSAQHLEYIHQYLAYSFYNIGKIDSARVHFLSLLSINSEMDLNPLDTSPKIIEFFIPKIFIKPLR